MHLHGLLSRRPQRGSGLGRWSCRLFSLAARTMEGPRVGVIQSRIRSVCFFVWFDVRGDFPHFLHENQRSFCYEKKAKLTGCFKFGETRVGPYTKLVVDADARTCMYSLTFKRTLRNISVVYTMYWSDLSEDFNKSL
jgi:hypothetical protein